MAIFKNTWILIVTYGDPYDKWYNQIKGGDDFEKNNVVISDSCDCSSNRGLRLL